MAVNSLHHRYECNNIEYFPKTVMFKTEVLLYCIGFERQVLNLSKRYLFIFTKYKKMYQIQCKMYKMK